MGTGYVGEMWAIPKPGPGATSLIVGPIEVSALIAGDGVDLVSRIPGRRTQTLQLSCDEARELAANLLKSADESEHL